MRRAGPADLAALVALQAEAYAGNRAILGGTPAPLTWDYAAVLAASEVWFAEEDGVPQGALVLDLREDDLYIASIAVLPEARRRGIGDRLLAFAEDRARQAGHPALRLVANALMTVNVGWYSRRGFHIERTETLGIGAASTC